MKLLLPTLAALLVSIPSAAGSTESERRLQEQERQIQQLETEIARLRWLLHRQSTQLTGDPLYGVTGSGRTTSDPPEESRTHIVEVGESLNRIAKKHGILPETLATLNRLENPQLVLAGQVLQLPPPQETHETPSADAIQHHTVQAGETLYRIALNHGIDLDELLAANPGIDPHSLPIGHHLRITARVPPPLAESSQ